MNYDMICEHVKYITSVNSNQIPNLEPKEMDAIVLDLMSMIKSMEKLDRLSIRRTCWETLKDANARQIIDLCFPAQLGPLSVWPPLKSLKNNSKDDSSESSHDKESAQPRKVHILKPDGPIKEQQEYSNKEIMIKLNALSQKVDSMSDLLQHLFTFLRHNGNKHTDS